VHANGRVLRCAAGGSATSISRYARTRRGRLRPSSRYCLVRGSFTSGALHLARANVENDRIRAKARPLIYGYGAAAAGAGAVPIPLVGLGGLASILAITLRVLAIRYGVAWSPGAFAQFSGAVGGGALVWWTLRYGLRETLKIIPMFGGVAAGTLNAAAAFGVTVGIGEAACVWLGYRRRGLMAPDSEVRRAFADGLASGLKFARSQTIQRRENNE
jgi:uncharacterized protein (DUF697 family)